MFNDRRRLSMQETAQGKGGHSSTEREGRSDQIAALYHREAALVRRVVSRQASVPADVLEDACQTAWTRLCSHPEVDVACPAAAVSWLVVTATRVAWRYSTVRERPTGVDREAEFADRELPVAAAGSPDPLDVVIRRDEARARLVLLSDRQRRMIALQAAGLTYDEISADTGATRRTVERQILSARHKLADNEVDGKNVLQSGVKIGGPEALFGTHPSRPQGDAS
jgi:RNA polymerase sigma factor (sigma-70 family)